MNRILEFSGGYLSIKVEAIEAIDIDPDDAKCVRIFLSFGPYNAHFDSEESAMGLFKDITEMMKKV